MDLSDFIPVIGDVANALSVSRQNRLNREFAAQQSDLAWQRSQEQWERETQYNSFSNQMRLLKDAGLNPNLAYDQSTDGASGQTPQMAQYSGVAPQFNSPMQIAQSRLIDAQVANLNQQTKNQMTEGQLKGVEYMSALKQFQAKENILASHDYYVSSVDEEGKTHYTLDHSESFNYWELLANRDASEADYFMKNFDVGKQDLVLLMTAMDDFGLSPSSAQLVNMAKDIRQKNKDFEISEKELEVLENNLQRLRMSADMLQQFEGDIDKCPEWTRPFLKLLLFMSMDGNLHMPNIRFNKNNTTVQRHFNQTVVPR